jgi:hypothetical protein
MRDPCEIPAKRLAANNVAHEKCAARAGTREKVAPDLAPTDRAVGIFKFRAEEAPLEEPSGRRHHHLVGAH